MSPTDIVELVLITQGLLIIGVVGGWIASERFYNYMMKERHHYEELFEENPHPECFDKDGKLNRGDYLTLNIEPGYDPTDFDPEDIIEES